MIGQQKLGKVAPREVDQVNPVAEIVQLIGEELRHAAFSLESCDVNRFGFYQPLDGSLPFVGLSQFVDRDEPLHFELKALGELICSRQRALLKLAQTIADQPRSVADISPELFLQVFETPVSDRSAETPTVGSLNVTFAASVAAVSKGMLLSWPAYSSQAPYQPWNRRSCNLSVAGELCSPSASFPTYAKKAIFLSFRQLI